MYGGRGLPLGRTGHQATTIWAIIHLDDLRRNWSTRIMLSRRGAVLVAAGAPVIAACREGGPGLAGLGDVGVGGVEQLLALGAHWVPRVVIAAAVGTAWTRLNAPLVPSYAHLGVVPPRAHGTCFTPFAPALMVPVLLTPVTTHGLLRVGLELIHSIPAKVNAARGGTLKAQKSMFGFLSSSAKETPGCYHAWLLLQMRHRHAGRVITDYLGLVEGCLIPYFCQAYRIIVKC